MQNGVQQARWPAGLEMPRAISNDYARICAGVLEQAGFASPAATCMSPQDPYGATECLTLQHLGLHRENQEDAASLQHVDAYIQGRRIAFTTANLADGCGGMAGGEIASAIACHELTKNIVSRFLRLSVEQGFRPRIEDMRSAWNTVFALANDSILQCSEENPGYHGMATTAVGAIVHGDMAQIAWAGDSRATLYRNGRRLRTTLDHNRAQSLVNAGILTEDEAAGHPGRSHLTNSLGTHFDGKPIPDVARWPIRPGDLLILSSDGFHEGITPDLASAVCAAYLAPPVTSEALRTLARIMESESLANYGGDNLTAVFIYIRNTSSV